MASNNSKNKATRLKNIKPLDYDQYLEKRIGRGDFIGPRGERGEIGPAGLNGLPGERGEPGTKGDPGIDGATGPKGSRGERGLTGERGDIGADGPKGDKGDTGPRGPKGDKGDRGEPGPKGDKGDPGPQGEQGETGRIPKHEWKNTKLRFEKPNGKWGEWIDLKAPLQVVAVGRGSSSGSGTPGVPGADGREVELQANATHIQWRYVGDVSWIDLIALSLLVGPAGADGADGADGAPGPNLVSTATATDITGILKGNGSVVSSASPGSDYVDPSDSRLTDSRAPNGSAGGVLNGTYPNPGLADGVVTKLKIGTSQVTNDRLGNVPTNTIKGRITAATGDPEDLTVTQVTSMLNNVVGDSGSGGTKGLVPAPAAGDAAAEKFFHADGTWKVPTIAPLAGTNTEMEALTPSNGTRFWNTTLHIEFIFNEGEWSPAAMIDPRYGGQKFDDFDANSGVSDLNWTVVGTVAASTGEAQAVGIIAMRTTAASSRAAMSLRSTGIVLGTQHHQLDFILRAPSLSTVTDDFVLGVGLNDNNAFDANGHAIDGAYFTYDRAVNGDAWITHTSDASTRTSTNSASAIVANTWYRLTLRIYPTSIVFKVNGTIIATHTTNIPTAPTGVQLKVDRVAGTASRGMDVHLFKHWYANAGALVS